MLEGRSNFPCICLPTSLQWLQQPAAVQVYWLLIQCKMMSQSLNNHKPSQLSFSCICVCQYTHVGGILKTTSGVSSELLSTSLKEKTYFCHFKFVFVCRCTCKWRSPKRPEGSDIPGSGITDVCGPHDLRAEDQTQVLCKNSMCP